MSKKQLFMTYLPIVLILALCVFLLIPSVFRSVKPLDPQLTVDALNEVTRAEKTLAKIGSKYYGSTPSLEFCSYFYFGSWEMMDEVRTGTPALILEFSEKWVMELFEDGLGCYATVYNGHVSFRTQSAVTYRIPLSVIDLLTHYFETYGTPHYFGDGTIGADSFAH